MKTDADGKRILQGDGSWPWLVAEIDGADIVVRGTAATWFGGDDDPQDSGATASGVNTKGHAGLLGCALPLNLGVRLSATQGSPIPVMPFFTQVKVFCPSTGLSVEVPLLDIGPAKSTHHGLDLTQAAFEALGGSLGRGVLHCDYRIVGGAQYVK